MYKGQLRINANVEETFLNARQVSEKLRLLSVWNFNSDRVFEIS